MGCMALRYSRIARSLGATKEKYCEVVHTILATRLRYDSRLYSSSQKLAIQSNFESSPGLPPQ